jgi:hypothetical protein
MASSMLARKTTFASRTAAPARRSRATVVRVQAFATDNGSKQSLEEMNRLIGLNIKEAAAHIGTMHVRQANAAIGKYVKKAAEEAAAGKLHSKGSKASAKK